MNNKEVPKYTLFLIEGYWLDDKSEISGALICSSETIVDELDDEDVFYYGFDETDIKREILLKEDTKLDYVITSYTSIALDKF